MLNRDNGTVIRRDETARALTSFAFTCEDQRARVVVNRRIRLRGIEVAVLVATRTRRGRELVSHAVVHGHLRVDAPVVLRIHGVVWIDLLQMLIVSVAPV